MGSICCENYAHGGDRTPVLLLTALDEVADRIKGLDAGADDYSANRSICTNLGPRAGDKRRQSGAPRPFCLAAELCLIPLKSP